MDLKTIYFLAKCSSDYNEFKSKIDADINGTPFTAVDKTEYKLVKSNSVLGGVIASLCESTKCNNLRIGKDEDGDLFAFKLTESYDYYTDFDEEIIDLKNEL